MLQYDVALSFAGEQRSDVLAVAECLKKAGINVFYDEYEKTNLWGKNLYDHLSDVYQNRAKYCVIFASKEYAEKTWTNLERQNAQARALKDKGAEYILPVRFDSTEIPGLLPTIGYLDFKREGAAGVCSALLAKLGKSLGASPIRSDAPLSCSLSPRALIGALDGKAAVPRVQSCIWGSGIEITVRGSEADSFFSHLRQEHPNVVLAYAFDVAVAKTATATRHVANGDVTWNLTFAPTQTDFNTFMEAGSGGTSADDFARMRVERLLLSKHLYRENQGASTLRQLNDVTHEVMIRGLNQAVKIEESPIPKLFDAFGSDPRRFLETAWITVVADLKRSGSVEGIDRLNLALAGTTLQVDFVGHRHRRYINVDPYEILVQGELKLGH